MKNVWGCGQGNAIVPTNVQYSMLNWFLCYNISTSKEKGWGT